MAGGLTCAAGHRPSFTPVSLVCSAAKGARWVVSKFQVIQRSTTQKLERGGAALQKSTGNLGRFPDMNSVTIQTGELDLTNFQFRIPCSNFDIQTEPYRNNFASNNYRPFPSNGENGYLGRPKMPSEERFLEL
jgi:hypothetical protein